MMAAALAGPPRFIELVFAEHANDKHFMDASDLATFLASEQGHEGGATPDYAASLISRFHEATQAAPSSGYDCMDVGEFFRFLSTPELNSLMQISQEPTHDMTAPLSHYFIYSSHNSYLTGNQLTSRSGTAVIEKALQDGCRVVELDCWDRNGEIMVLHGHTLTKPVRFDDCLRAIKENAFVTSEYPVIITIENHLPVDLQVEAARMMRDILADLLYVPSPDERPPRLFASPEDLKHKILISDTPPKESLPEQAATDPQAVVDTFPYIVPYPPDLNNDDDACYDDDSDDDDSPPFSPKSHIGRAKRGIARRMEMAADALFHHHRHNRDASNQDDEQVQRVNELEELIYIFSEKLAQVDVDSTPGLPRPPGDNSIMANLSEPQLKKLMKVDAMSLVKYTHNNLGRMYPFGLRFNSSNANPCIAWAHGFQMAAINIQGRDRACWITRALFDGNGKCGFVKKPPILLPTTSTAHDDPMLSEPTAEIAPRLLLKVRVLMGFDCYKAHTFWRRHDLYIKIAIDGHPSDKAKKKTDAIPYGEELNWEHQLFEFPIRVPEIAILRFEVWDQDKLKHDSFIGQACFCVAEMKVGIRTVSLRARDGEPLHSNNKLLCWVQMEEWAT